MVVCIEKDSKDTKDIGKSKNEMERRHSRLCSLVLFFLLVGVKDYGYLQKKYIVRIRLSS